MEREIKKIETKGGHSVEIKTYLTLDESDQIQDALMSGMRVEIGSDGQTTPPAFDASAIKKSRNAAIEAIVVSVDGLSESVLEKFLALPATDAMEALAEIDKVKSGFDDEKKD